MSQKSEVRSQRSEARSQKSGVLPGIISAMLLLAGGVVHGTWTHRWQKLDRSDGPESRLHRVPMSLDDWDGKDTPISDAEQKMAGLTNYLQRTYTSRRTGDTVTVTLMCGPTGPIAVHPPTACYHGAGYQQSGATRSAVLNVPTGSPSPHGSDSTTLTDQSDHKGTSPATDDYIRTSGVSRYVFAVADFFQPSHPEASQPRIYWAWSADGMWRVPDSPRLEFAGRPTLFKLYVTFERPFDKNRSAASPAETLLKLLLPVIQQEVFGPNVARRSAS